MLTRLSVENYALIDQLDIALAPGLNIITGETGAGKSILLGALGLILGNRGDVSVLRETERNCLIEGEFDLHGYGLEALFDATKIDYDPLCIIRRVITPAGKSRAYVNDQPVQLATLREIGDRLIDIHSQHQSLLLADNRFQTDIVDSVAAHDALLADYRKSYTDLCTAGRELADLRCRAEENGRNGDYITFQLEQLHEARLQADEQEELETLLNQLEHASEIRETLLFATQAFDADEGGVLVQLKNLELSVGRLQKVYPQAELFRQRLHGTLLDLRDLAGEISSESERVEADPSLLERTQRRLDLIYTLQQKHKVDSVTALLELQAGYEEQLASIEGYADRLEALTAQVETLHLSASSLAVRLTEERAKAAPQVEKHVVEMLAGLGIPAAQLEVEISPADTLGPEGADRIRFLFTANRNTRLQPVDKTASGGETSRLMLSLKALVASHARLPTLIFDEIDSGVSGSIADRMGGIVAGLAQDMQIINITHLPQVASKGETHFFVYKEEAPQGTVTRIRKLTPEERIGEIAQMLSGSDITPAARQQACLLLGLKQPKTDIRNSL